MEVLTSVLNSMRLSGEVLCRFELTAPWGISVPRVAGAAFHVIDRGSCWLRFKDGSDLIPLAGGDLVVFSKGREHEIVDAPQSLSLPFEELICSREQDSLLLYHGGGGTPTTIICGVFNFQEGRDHALLSLLPPMIHIKGDEGHAVQWLDITLKFMAAEAASSRPGAETIVDRLTDILFVQAIRAWIDSYTEGTRGWLAALSDPQISTALRHIHESPGQRWTVASLAAVVGLSRSAFSARFASLVGDPPLQYLTAWRMRLAANWLTDTDLSISEISDRVSYQSEDPFNRAFRRHVGMSPGRYRRHPRAQPNRLDVSTSVADPRGGVATVR